MDIATKERILTDYLTQYQANVSAVGIHQLATIADQAYFPKNSMVLDIDQPSQYVYFITDGVARSYYLDEDGNNVTKNFFLEGDFLDGEGLFSDLRTEAFDAVEDLRCLRFEVTTMKPVLFQHKDLTQLYIFMLEETLRYKMSREHAFQSLTAQQRYEAFQERFGSAEKRLPQNQIASYIGIKKESLSRIRKKMANS
ncbi:cyclic nucleotide-binding protein [Secundilactobacillus paracollinoides]|uniref:Crp/Fnr family transcriptional regulator n=1 Tax=Secundilactobacillus paracollinoides TaxID=240427 RepID=UPI0006D08642|nr:Crp/Fnr family transcriptional regulator [Secundilactobacillus paracollinoides]ANZ65005.1 cyclic nucleotide-binding protein [Secundilactobacillus paracollinoides]KRL78829.1 Crp Fnr family transcriptional regulator [Secundilactobacillus paracollinoides DSM 15502 = JCM 11969]